MPNANAAKLATMAEIPVVENCIGALDPGVEIVIEAEEEIDPISNGWIMDFGNIDGEHEIPDYAGKVIEIRPVQVAPKVLMQMHSKGPPSCVATSGQKYQATNF